MNNNNCRICLECFVSFQLETISAIKISGKPATEIIFELFGLQLLPEDLTGNLIPSKLCGSCKNRLEEAYSLKTLIWKSQEKIQVRAEDPLAPSDGSDSDDEDKEDIPNLIAGSDLEDQEEPELTADQEPLKSFVCTFCAKQFKQRGELNKHVKFHSNIRNYHCSLCTKSFKTSNHLLDHERSHIGLKPYKCKMCPKAFVQSSGLLRHMRRRHNAERYTCDSCGKTFGDKYSLTIHMDSHRMRNCSKDTNSNNRVRKYPCTLCEKVFLSSNHLNMHKVVHTGDKQYKCSLCDVSFTQSSGLYKHKRNIHKVQRRFKCTECRCDFKSLYEAKRHVLGTHPGVKCDPVIKEINSPISKDNFQHSSNLF